MKFGHLFILLAFLVTGCASYRHKDSHPLESKLDGAKGVLISTPDDGVYGSIPYPSSGRMTANAVRAAFAYYSQRVDVVNDCQGKICLEGIDNEEYGYYVLPEILHWEDRNAAWSGRRDHIEVQLVVFDSETKKELSRSTLTGKSRRIAFRNAPPQDLLKGAAKSYVRSLYQ